MKNIIKSAVVASLLIIACLLIGACGSSNSTEYFVQGLGKIDVTVTNSATGLALTGVLIQVRDSSNTGTVIDSWTTDATGKHSFNLTIATNYYFTFTAPGYTPQSYVNNPVKSDLTTTQTVSVAMVPL